MSARARIPETRVEQNRQTLKSLVKLEANKSCADCKRNKHPRWASWNLGVFVCIRCSGIHRSMGVHISRVKSVDLDSWTDEQTQNMLKWGNARANKYWESKLAPGHMPSETKIENFIRTKYESKRWVMDGPMPDPSTLEVDGDDDVPLNLVKEQVKLERSTSQKLGVSAARQTSSASRATPAIDLIGGDEPMARPSTDPPVTRAPPPKAQAAPPKTTKPADSLLGLDFFAPAQSAPAARPATTTTTGSSGPSRPDLKQSILSLYAPAPKQLPQAQQPPAQSGNLVGTQSSTASSQPAQASSNFGGFSDAFSSLSFSAQPAQEALKPSPFSGLDTMAKPGTHTSKVPFGGGSGGFFDSPKSPTKPTPQKSSTQRTLSSSSGFGDFFSSTSPTVSAAPAPTSGSLNPSTKANSNDLFDLGFDAPVAPAPAPAKAAPSPSVNSAFNLSNPQPLSQPVAAPKPAASNSALAGLSNNFEAWGSSDVWGSVAQPAKAPPAATNNPDWGSTSSGITPSAVKTTSPKISGDEDFGGWSTAPPTYTSPQNPSTTQTSKPATSFNNDDLFSNVWE